MNQLKDGDVFTYSKDSGIKMVPRDGVAGALMTTANYGNSGDEAVPPAPPATPAPPPPPPPPPPPAPPCWLEHPNKGSRKRVFQVKKSKVRCEKVFSYVTIGVQINRSDKQYEIAAGHDALLKFRADVLAHLERVSVHVQFSGQGGTERVEAGDTHRKDAKKDGMFSKLKGEKAGERGGTFRAS